MELTRDQLRQFAKRPPPREVPKDLARAVVGKRFSGGLGLAILAGTIGLLALPFLFPWELVDAWRLDRAAAHTTGSVVRKENTLVAEGRTQRETVGAIFAYGAEFKDSTGATHESQSFCRDNAFEIGQHVVVEYLNDDPRTSRIQGCRVNMTGPWLAAVALVPLGAFGLAGYLVARRLRRRRLLASGILASGRVVRVEEATVQETRNPTKEATVTFDVAGTPHTFRQPIPAQQEAVADSMQKEGSWVDVLYDPRRPDRAYALDFVDG